MESAHLSPDKQHMVVGGKDMWAYMLDFPSGKPVMVRPAALAHAHPAAEHPMRLEGCE